MEDGGGRGRGEEKRESEEEVYDFGVGVGAWGWGGCQLVLFPVDKTLRSLSLCRSLSLSYSAILSLLPPLLPPSLLLSCEMRLGEKKGLDKFKGKKNSGGRCVQTLHLSTGITILD